MGKLRAASRRSALAQALVEFGGLQRTLYALRYLADETYRSRITRQLNKGETLHSLRRDLFFAHGGTVRRRRHEQQTEQALYGTYEFPVEQEYARQGYRPRAHLVALPASPSGDRRPHRTAGRSGGMSTGRVDSYGRPDDECVK